MRMATMSMIHFDSHQSSCKYICHEIIVSFIFVLRMLSMIRKVQPYVHIYRIYQIVIIYILRNFRQRADLFYHDNYTTHP